MQDCDNDLLSLTAAGAPLQGVLESARISLVSRDAELRCIDVYSPRLGERAERVRGTLPEDIYPPEDARALRALYQAVLDRGEPRQGLLRLRYNDAPRQSWMEIQATPIRDPDGEVVGIRASAYDVSAHVQTRLALDRREALLELALSASAMSYWECDLDTGAISRSASAKRVWGFGDGEGTRLADYLARIHPDDRERAARRLEELPPDGAKSEDKFRVVREDGSLHWVSIRWQLQRNDDGRPRRLVGITADITEEYLLRERLEHSNRELARFALTVAHDLKSPVRVVHGFASLLAHSAADRLDAVEREHLGYVIETAAQMNELVDGVLRYAQGINSDRREPVDLNKALEQCLLRLRVDIREAEASITHDPLPTVAGNAVLVTQVLQNLLANAMKYRADRPLSVHLGAWRDAGEWIVSVRDNGIGIAPEQQARLFQSFTRGHDESLAYPGVGLGLALVRKAVEHHGGRVWLDSVPGEGSTFYFSLPDAQPPAASTERSG